METFLPFILPAAFVLDLVIGDPEWLPHPVRWIGRGISLFENLLRRGPSSPGREKFSGGILALCTVTLAYVLSGLALYASLLISEVFFFALSTCLVWSGLAVKSLKDEVEGVLKALEEDGLPASRKRLKRIVGRDVEDLSREGVLRGAAETLSENTSDGIVAPLFYLAAGTVLSATAGSLLGIPPQTAYIIGGPPALLAYKAVNTLDSMVGYRNARHLHFGFFSARLDDLANYIPARITALLMVASSVVLGYDWKGAVAITLRDGRKHPSPNAGIPEAAVAGALGVRFGGPASYGAVPSEKPFIGENLKALDEASIRSAIRITGLSALLMVFIVFSIHFLVL